MVSLTEPCVATLSFAGLTVSDSSTPFFFFVPARIRHVVMVAAQILLFLALSPFSICRPFPLFVFSILFSNTGCKDRVGFYAVLLIFTVICTVTWFADITTRFEIFFWPFIPTFETHTIHFIITDL